MSCPTCQKPMLSEQPHLHLEDRRRQLAGRGYRLDPDPLHVDEDPAWDPRVPGEPGGGDPPGLAIVLAIVGIPLVILILVAIVAILVATPSPVQPAPTPAGLGAAQSGAPREREGEAAMGGRSPMDRQDRDAPPAVATTRGLATWYDAPSLRDAAAGPALRRALGRHWRGATVRVCALYRCVTVRLTDWCACGPRHGTPTVIDLDDRAFRHLAPLSAGVVRVTVALAGASRWIVPTAPPTDVRGAR